MRYLALVLLLVSVTGIARPRSEWELPRVPLSDAEFARRDRRFSEWVAAQPSLGQALELAYRHFDLSFARFTEWERAARRSAGLPKLQLGYGRDLTEANTLSINDTVAVNSGEVTVGPPDAETQYDVDQAEEFEVKLLWNLSDLVYSRDQILMSRERRSIADARLALAARMSELYSERQRLALHWFLVDDSPARSDVRAKQLSLNQALNALCGATLFTFSPGDE